MKIKQILLTWFNRRFDSGSFSKALDDDWLQYRLNLFKKYTYPSILYQTNKNFDWVLLCHEDTPDWLKKELNKMKLYSNIYFLYDDNDPYLEKVNSYKMKYNVVLTTRIDSDDCFHKTALQVIRQSFINTYSENIQIINFELGYQYDCISQRLFLAYLNSPPFSTKINYMDTSEPLDCGPNHSVLKEKFHNIVICKGDPMFLQVIHGNNALNKINYKASPINKNTSKLIRAS